MTDDIDRGQQNLPPDWVAEEVTVVAESAAGDLQTEAEPPASGGGLTRLVIPGAGALLALIAVAVLVVLWRKRVQPLVEIEEPQPARRVPRIPQWRRAEAVAEPASIGRVAGVREQIGSRAGTMRDRAIQTVRRSPAPEPPPTKREVLARSMTGYVPTRWRR